MFPCPSRGIAVHTGSLAAKEIRAFNARHGAMLRRFPRARFRFERPGERAVAYLYADGAEQTPIGAGVARGPGFDALREAASRAMDAAGFRS